MSPFSVFNAKGHVGECTGCGNCSAHKSEGEEEFLIPASPLPKLGEKQADEPFFPRPEAGDDEPLLPTGVKLED
jgi:hypothetical protein